MTRIAVALVAALVLSGVALAAKAPTGPPRLTVAKANAAMVTRKTYIDLVATNDLSGHWNLAGTVTEPRGDAFFGHIASATCKGVGAPIKRAFAGFSCDLQLDMSPSPGVQSGTYWVRPISDGRVCASDRTLAACPLPLPTKPLPGDPRVCREGDLAYCMNEAAKAASLAHGGRPIGLGCLATKVFVYRCTWLPPVGSTDKPGSTVTFVAGKTAWSTTVQ